MKLAALLDTFAARIFGPRRGGKSPATRAPAGEAKKPPAGNAERGFRQPGGVRDLDYDRGGHRLLPPVDTRLRPVIHAVDDLGQAVAIVKATGAKEIRGAVGSAAPGFSEAGAVLGLGARTILDETGFKVDPQTAAILSNPVVNLPTAVVGVFADDISHAFDSWTPIPADGNKTLGGGARGSPDAEQVGGSFARADAARDDGSELAPPATVVFAPPRRAGPGGIPHRFMED